MRVDSSKMKAIALVARSLAKAQSQLDALHVVDRMNTSRNGLFRNRDRQETLSEYIDDQVHELHCLCVEADLAAPEPERYGRRIVSSSNGTAQLEKIRRTPKTT